MGVAVIARASAFPSSNFRNRLIALGAFGLFHAAASWVSATVSLHNGPPYYLEDVVYLPRSLALYYFAFGWDEEHPFRAHTITGASLLGLVAASQVIAEPEFMDVLTRYGIAIPASICAGIVFAYDKSFQFKSAFADFTRWSVSAAFIVYAIFQVFSDSGDVFPARFLNAETFAAVTGFSAPLPRSVSVGVIGIGTLFLLNRFDLVMREQTKAAFASLDAKLSRVLQVETEAIIIADHDGRILMFNEGAKNIFGYTQEETVGQSIEMLMPMRFRGAHHGYVREFAASSDTSRKMGERNEITGLRKSGEEFPARATISKFMTPEGVTYTLILRDITILKAVRQELIAAKTAAETANAAKSNFIANMSHELRTPLNAILGFSETMRLAAFGPLGNPKYREYASDIYKSGRHLLDIINDILSLSELDAEKKQLSDPGPVQVQILLEECVKWTRERAPELGVEVQVDIPPDISALRGDERLLTQVFLNLLTNAVKFTPDGGTVTVSAEEGKMGRVRVSVHDTGIGMTPEQIAHVGGALSSI